MSSDQVGRIANVLDSQQNLLERDRFIFLRPAKRGWKAFVFCEKIISA
jgi:hypothetical protein